MQNVNRGDLRSRFEEVDRLYQREKDSSYDQQQSKVANKAGDPTKTQNITVPVVMPQVETAVTYQTSVFLTGYPIFGVVTDPAFMDAALQLETKIDNDAERGGWTREISMFFRDGFKYNFSAMEVDWKRKVTPAVETAVGQGNNAVAVKRTIWSGNNIKRLDPYNVFVDTRVPPAEVYKRGEFAGYTESMSRIELKAFIEELPDKIAPAIRPALESGTSANSNVDSSAMNYYTPDINPLVPETDYKLGDTNWLKWAHLSDISGKSIQYKESYEVTTLYCRVLPSEFGLRVPNRNIPQVYKLIIVNHEHIIYAEKQSNAHNWIPIFIGQPNEDGLGYQTKSLATNAEPFQSVTTTYMSSIIASRRRAISDRSLYDPSRVSSAHINSPNPSAKIPVKPSAYGKPLSEAVYPFPYREDQAASSMQQIQMLLGMSNQLSGQNQASQGQFVKGNKTLHEFESVMQNANGRDQGVAILLEAQVFAPIKQVLKFNTLQYVGGETLYNKEKQRTVTLDPVALRKAVLEFKVTDGLIPASKVLNTDSFSVALQVIGSSPQISGAYNIAPMFSYLMKAQGAVLTDFEKSQEQIAYEQAVQSWQQVVVEAMKQGTAQEQLPPQPLPEQYGYNPKGARELSPREQLAQTATTALSEAPTTPTPTQQ